MAMPSLWVILVFGSSANLNLDVGPAPSCLRRAVDWTPVNKALRGAIHGSQPRRILRNCSTLPALADQSVTTLAGRNSSSGPLV